MTKCRCMYILVFSCYRHSDVSLLTLTMYQSFKSLFGISHTLLRMHIMSPIYHFSECTL